MLKRERTNFRLSKSLFHRHPKCNSFQRETLFSCLCYFASSRRRCGSKGSTAVQLLLIGNVPVMQHEPFLQTFSSKFRNYVVPSLPTYRRQNLRRTLPHFHVYQTPDGERERKGSNWRRERSAGAMKFDGFHRKA